MRGKEQQNGLYPLAENQPCTANNRPRIRGLSEKQIRNFWKCVDKSQPECCWKWTGRQNKSGRGVVKLYGIQLLAPRVSYAFHSEADPGQWDVLHTCDNPSCVNPGHLFLGTPLINATNRESKNRGNQSKGEDHGRHKLNEDQVREIKASSSSRGLAKRYGVARQIIWRIRTGKLWSHIN